MLLDEDLFAFPGEMKKSAIHALVSRPKNDTQRAFKLTKSIMSKVELPLFDLDTEVMSDSKTLQKEEFDTSILGNHEDQANCRTSDEELLTSSRKVIQFEEEPQWTAPFESAPKADKKQSRFYERSSYLQAPSASTIPAGLF